VGLDGRHAFAAAAQDPVIDWSLSQICSCPDCCRRWRNDAADDQSSKIPDLVPGRKITVVRRIFRPDIEDWPEPAMPSIRLITRSYVRGRKLSGYHRASLI